MSGQTLHRVSWVQEVMRFGQINMREFEPPHVDVGWWRDFFRRCGIQAATLNAGGIVAYYPTKLPYHWRSRWLGDRDVFGELVAMCNEEGIRVLARFDPSRMHQDFYYNHPDWFMVQADGNPLIRRDRVTKTTGPELYYTCITGPFYHEFIPQLFAEVHANYSVDGFYGNGWSGSHEICHCGRCRARFKEATGLDLPRDKNWDDPVWRQWLRWRTELDRDLWQFWDKTTREIKPETVFWGNHGIGTVARFAQGTSADFQGRRGYDPVWLAGEQARRMASVTDGKPYFHIFCGNAYSRHHARPDAEQQLWAASGLASNARPWFTIIGAIQEDRRQFEPIARVFEFHKENDAYWHGRESLANVALLWSEHQARLYGRDDVTTRVTEHFRGMYYALMRGRIPFDLMHEDWLSEEALAKYKVLVLANAAALSDAQCDAIRAFAQKGGSIVATYETSLYDEWGQPRGDYGIGDVLGVRSVRGKVMGPLLHSYLRIVAEHEILASIDNTSITLNSLMLAPAQATTNDTLSPLTLIPPYSWLPPELAFPEIPETDWPMVFVREVGQTRTIYFPGDMDRLVWLANLPDAHRIMSNAVRWAARADFPVQVAGPGLVEVTAYGRPQDIQIHLVNYSNPDVWHAPIHEILPVGAQTVRVRVPEDKTVTSVRLLVAQREAPVDVESGVATVQVPCVASHEVVVLALS